MSRRIWAHLVPAWLLLAPAAAAARDLPPTLEQMLREAYPAERRAVANVAKRIYPDSKDQIDRFVQSLEGEKKAQLADADLLEGWTGEASVGGFLTTGNTDEWGLSVAASFKRKSPRWTHELDLRVDVKEEDGVRTEEQGYGRFTLRRKLGTSPWFAFGRLSFERDRLQGIDSRFFEAVGIGHQIADTRRFDWDVMAGPGLRQTSYSDATDVSEAAIFLRTKLNWQISGTLRFSEEMDAGLAEQNSTFTATSALTSDLYGNLSGRISFGVEVETDPPQGREEVDTYTRASLVYRF